MQPVLFAVKNQLRSLKYSFTRKMLHKGATEERARLHLLLLASILLWSLLCFVTVTLNTWFVHTHWHASYITRDWHVYRLASTTRPARLFWFHTDCLHCLSRLTFVGSPPLPRHVPSCESPLAVNQYMPQANSGGYTHTANGFAQSRTQRAQRLKRTRTGFSCLSQDSWKCLRQRPCSCCTQFPVGTEHKPSIPCVRRECPVGLPSIGAPARGPWTATGWLNTDSA